jgi:hypothetical protein
MRASLFWLNDEPWAKIKPIIPMSRPVGNREIVFKQAMFIRLDIS